MGITQIERPWPPENKDDLIDIYEVLGRVSSDDIIQLVIIFDVNCGSVHDSCRIVERNYDEVEIVNNNFIGKYRIGSENYRVHISRADDVFDKTTTSISVSNEDLFKNMLGIYCSEDN